MRACAYGRVSTILKQDVQNQLTLIREHCKSREMTLVSEYVDRGVSGARERRPALDQMLADAQQKKFDVIIIAALDRLGRNVLHFLKILQQLESIGVKLISLREQLDFSSTSGRMVLTVLLGCNQMEREIISTRIREALAAKKILAQKTGNGWKCGRKPVVTELITAEVQSLRKQGLSIRQISKKVGIAKSTVQKVLVQKSSLKCA